MIPLRTSEAMVRDGFVTIPVPEALTQLMVWHIGRYIAAVSGVPLSDKFDVVRSTAAMAGLADDNFVQKFKKPLRMFPDRIGGAINEWIESLAKFLGGSRSGINYVSQSERELNAELKPTSFDVFWRCVRPGKPDVGHAHADFQFWEINRGTPLDPPSPFEYDERWKIWMPLKGCDKSNSLEILAGSHREDIPIESIQTKFGIRPKIGEQWLAAHQDRFFCPLPKFENYCVLFHDKLVHRGPANTTDHLRISGELTILLKL